MEEHLVRHRHGCRWEDNVKIGIKEVGYEDKD